MMKQFEKKTGLLSIRIFQQVNCTVAHEIILKEPKNKAQKGDLIAGNNRQLVALETNQRAKFMQRIFQMLAAQCCSILIH